MSVTDELLENNEKYAAGFSGPLPLPPSKDVAVLACMDARLDVFPRLGIAEGESHVIRNAGGVVTDDAIRTLAISQRLLGTREIVLVHHTDCGMLTFSDEEFAEILRDARRLATRAGWARGRSPTSTRTSAGPSRRIRRAPFIPHTDQVRGFVFDVADGRLAEVV